MCQDIKSSRDSDDDSFIRSLSSELQFHGFTVPMPNLFEEGGDFRTNRNTYGFPINITGKTAASASTSTAMETLELFSMSWVLTQRLLKRERF